MKITDSVELLEGVGPVRLKQLKGANIATIKDLIYFFPRIFSVEESLFVILIW